VASTYTITYPPTADGLVREFLRQLNMHPSHRIVSPGTVSLTETHEAYGLIGLLKGWGYFSSLTAPTSSVASMAPKPT